MKAGGEEKNFIGTEKRFGSGGRGQVKGVDGRRCLREGNLGEC